MIRQLKENAKFKNEESRTNFRISDMLRITTVDGIRPAWVFLSSCEEISNEELSKR